MILLRYSIFSLLFSLVCGSCTKNIEPSPSPNPIPPQDSITTEKIDILALGDSYTKGESVPWTENFPNQLSRALQEKKYLVTGLRVIAQTGWRTDQLLSALQNQNQDIKDSTFSLVTLCIGVNNQYTSGDVTVYQAQFEQLLLKAIQRAGGRKERVIVLSIPDYAYTPFGQGNTAISAELDEFNAINKNITNQYGISYVNVTDISRGGLNYPELVAGDGLHPSAKQYTAWVNLLLPACEIALKP
jgi:lysophospholipase L1-like esterase